MVLGHRSGARSRLRMAAAFAAWTAFTFLCHYSAKRFLQVSRDGIGSKETPPLWSLLLALVLTCAQLVACYVSLNVSIKVSSFPSPTEESGRPAWAGVLAAFTHFCATFATNYSLAIMYAPSTLTIKLMEPVTSALVVWIASGRPASPVTLASLGLLLIGSWGFVGNPLSSLQLGAGTALAIISNFFYGVRNVIIKHMLGGTTVELCAMKESVVYASVTILSYWYYTYDGTGPSLPLNPVGAWMPLTSPIALVLASAASHVLYSYTSTCLVLDYFSVIGHAVANIVKRLLVVLLMVACGQRAVEMHRLLWLLVCFAGLAVYIHNKLRTSGASDHASSRASRKWVTVPALTATLTVLLSLTCLSLLRGAARPPRAGIAGGSQMKDELMGQHSPAQLRDIKDMKMTNSANKIAGNHIASITSKSIENIIGRNQNVIVAGFPLTLSREDSMDTIGLIYCLKDLGSNTHNYNFNSNNVKDIRNKFTPGTDISVFLTVKNDNLQHLLLLSKMDSVKNLIILMPSAASSRADILKEDAFKNIVNEAKVRFLVSDNVTFEYMENALGKILDKVTLIPSLAFSIPRVYRWLKPLYHYVWQQKSPSANGCHFLDKVECISKDWNKQWKSPKGAHIIEDAYINTFMSAMFLLQGKVVVVDSLVGVIIAMQFNIPVVVITGKDSVTMAYVDTWQFHGYDMAVFAKDEKDAANKAKEIMVKYEGRIADFEPGITIFEDMHTFRQK